MLAFHLKDTMALTQQKFREIVFQLLYSQELAHPDESLMLELMMNELAVSKKNIRLAQERVHLIEQHLPKIDPMIASASTSYEFDRIQTVTKNILRLAAFELFFDEAIPPKVAIAEAIRLSRKFNTPESASFVNALLDHLYQSSLGGQADSSRLEKEAHELLASEQAALEAAKQHNPMGEAFPDDKV